MKASFASAISKVMGPTILSKMGRYTLALMFRSLQDCDDYYLVTITLLTNRPIALTASFKA